MLAVIKSSDSADKTEVLLFENSADMNMVLGAAPFRLTAAQLGRIEAGGSCNDGREHDYELVRDDKVVDYTRT